MIVVERATIEHAERMAPNMRREDAAETVALGMNPMEALRTSLDGSSVAEAAIIGDDVAAMWGACPPTVLGNNALLWMLGTDLVPRNPKALLRLSRAFVARMHERYPVLACLVDMRYHQAMTWTHWLGFRQVALVSTPDTPFALCQKET